MKTQLLYRPVGLRELELIAATDWNAFPPRLDWQPIFYPVLNETYAAQIASQWNTGDEFSGYCGAVTAFEVDAAYLTQYHVQNVGDTIHDELWVPAAALAEFNAHIVNGIQVINMFFGERFIMPQRSKAGSVISKFVKQ